MKLDDVRHLLNSAFNRLRSPDVIHGKRLDFDRGEVTFLQPLAEETSHGSGRYVIYVIGHNSTKWMDSRGAGFKQPCFGGISLDKETAARYIDRLNGEFEESLSHLPLAGLREKEISDFAPLGL